MRVSIPNPLLSYTAQARTVEATGKTLGMLLDALEHRYPGIRFRVIDEQGRIRPHVKFFINAVQARSLDMPLREGDEIMIVAALSGG